MELENLIPTVVSLNREDKKKYAKLFATWLAVVISFVQLAAPRPILLLQFLIPAISLNQLCWPASFCTDLGFRTSSVRAAPRRKSIISISQDLIFISLTKRSILSLTSPSRVPQPHSDFVDMITPKTAVPEASVEAS